MPTTRPAAGPAPHRARGRGLEIYGDSAYGSGQARADALAEVVADGGPGDVRQQRPTPCGSPGFGGRAVPSDAITAPTTPVTTDLRYRQLDAAGRAGGRADTAAGRDWSVGDTVEVDELLPARAPLGDRPQLHLRDDTGTADGGAAADGGADACAVPLPVGHGPDLGGRRRDAQARGRRTGGGVAEVAQRA